MKKLILILVLILISGCSKEISVSLKEVETDNISLIVYNTSDYLLFNRTEFRTRDDITFYFNDTIIAHVAYDNHYSNFNFTLLREYCRLSYKKRDYFIECYSNQHNKKD